MVEARQLYTGVATRAMASKTLLLRGGVALIHDANNHVVPTKSDVLVEDGKITRIAHDINPSEGTETIDCTDKIISPGFIDTHRHAWQTQLKGRHANEQLLDYMVTGMASCRNRRPHFNKEQATRNLSNTRPRMSSTASSPVYWKALQLAQLRWLNTHISPAHQNTPKPLSQVLHLLACVPCSVTLQSRSSSSSTPSPGIQIFSRTGS